MCIHKYICKRYALTSYCYAFPRWPNNRFNNLHLMISFDPDK